MAGILRESLVMAGATLLVFPVEGSHQAAGTASGAQLTVLVSTTAGDALAGARVFLTGLTAAVHKVAEAGDDGRALFEQLPAGQYTVAAEHDGFVRAAFAGADPDEPIPVVLAGGDRFSATVTLPRGAEIAGVVVDDGGTPTIADVRAHRYSNGPGGARRLQVVARTQSDAGGRYRFRALRSGEYFVSATSRTASGTRIAAPVFFHAAREAASATTIRVASGEAVDHVNIQAVSSTAAHLRGVLLGPSGQGMPAAMVQILGAEADPMGVTQVRSNDSGEFSATLAPGTYAILSAGAETIETTLAAGTTSDIVIPSEPGGAFAGRLRFEGTAPRVAAGSAVFELVPVGTPYAHLLPGIAVRITDADRLAFEARGIPPGTYRIRSGAALAAWMLESARVADRDLLDTGVQIRRSEAVAGIAVEVMRQGAEIVGTLLDETGRPVFNRRVLVFPAARQLWIEGSRRVRWAQPNTTGRFAFHGLPAGDYWLAVVAEAAGAGWSATLLEDAAAQALRVSVPQGTLVTRDVKTVSR